MSKRMPWLFFTLALIFAFLAYQLSQSVQYFMGPEPETIAAGVYGFAIVSAACFCCTAYFLQRNRVDSSANEMKQSQARCKHNDKLRFDPLKIIGTDDESAYVAFCSKCGTAISVLQSSQAIEKEITELSNRILLLENLIRDTRS